MKIINKGLNNFKPILVSCPEPLCNAQMAISIEDISIKTKPVNWLELYVACTCPCCKSIIDVTQFLPEDVRNRIIEIGEKQIPPDVIPA